MKGLVIFFIVLYLAPAGLAGWWPFRDSVVQTLSGRCTYDRGYDDGWDGAASACEAVNYLHGYDDGAFDSECDWLKCSKRDFDQFRDYGCGRWDAVKCY